MKAKKFSVDFEVCIDDEDLLGDQNSYFNILNAAVQEFKASSGFSAVLLGASTDNCYVAQLVDVFSLEDLKSLYDWVKANEEIEGVVLSKKYPVYFSDFSATNIRNFENPIAVTFNKWEEEFFTDDAAAEKLQAQYEQRRNAMLYKELSRAERRALARRIARKRRAKRDDVSATYVRQRIAKIKEKLNELGVEDKKVIRKADAENERLEVAKKRVATLRRLLRKAEKEFNELRETKIEHESRFDRMAEAEIIKRRAERRAEMLAELRKRRKAFAAYDEEVDNKPKMLRRKRDGKLFVRTDLFE